MPDEFEPIAREFYAKSLAVFKKAILEAEVEAKKRRLSPIYTFAFINSRVEQIYANLTNAMNVNSQELNNAVYGETDRFLTSARQELRGYIEDMMHSSTLGEMIAKNEQLHALIEDSGIASDLSLFEMSFGGEQIQSMRDYKKYIFDLDYTLLIPDWSMEDDFLKKRIPTMEQEEFFKQKQAILNSYELEFPRYDFKSLSAYFKSHGFTVTEDVINGWMIHNGETIKDEVVDGVIELFKYLKENGKEIVILTSWFSGTQIPRLKRAGLYEYVDRVIAGEDAMKPDLESFKLAIGNTDKKDCIMIGDSIKSDKVGALNAGIDCYIVDAENTLRKFLQMVKCSNGNSIHLSANQKTSNC